MLVDGGSLDFPGGVSDRPDLQFAAKVDGGTIRRRKRGIVQFPKYLNGEYRKIVHLFPFGSGDKVRHAFYDSARAGHLKLRKPTSEGSCSSGSARSSTEPWRREPALFRQPRPRFARPRVRIVRSGVEVTRNRLRRRPPDRCIGRRPGNDWLEL